MSVRCRVAGEAASKIDALRDRRETGDAMLFDLSGKVALVTGGNGGIGLGMAKGLREAGARVAIAGRNAAKAAAALAELGEGAIFIETNLADQATCHAMVAQCAERLGRLDILVNNAGILVRKPPQDVSEAEWRGVMAVNIDAAFYACQAAYREMKKLGGGKIINIGSVMSVTASAYAAPYAASKAAIMNLSKALAVSWAADNIQVNAVLPGWIDTELTQGARAQVQGLNEAILARVPAGRWGNPSDLAGTAVFLASGASDFVTGAAIPVDGGYLSRT
jgi:2-deoxy-D-gluconate 3-dehydrogenase